ncbi:MAG: hypothetical protein JW795_19310 [Chitinivibrionales bacterium]|nr:hypothetical protein [Chitinivibrionales bacterium]
MVRIVSLMIAVMILCSGLLFHSGSQSFDVPNRMTIGVGNRAISMGGNYVALANDASALFWNPAGFAFTPVREFHVGLGGLQRLYNLTTTASGLDLKESAIERNRYLFNSISLLRAVPTTQGGFSWGIGFQNPYICDNISQTSTSRFLSDYTASGSMNLWSAGFGVQVAPNLGAGISAGLLTGSATMKLKNSYFQQPSAPNDSSEEYTSSQNYSGLDVRAGILYSIVNVASIGIRLELPQLIGFEERLRQRLTFKKNGKDTTTSMEDLQSGSLKSSPQIAAGFSIRLPFILLSAEAGGRAPIPEGEDHSVYAHWKVGAGAGFEAAIVRTLLLSGGYHWNELDDYPLLMQFKDPRVVVETDRDIRVLKDDQLVSAGLSYMTQTNISFELAYSYRFWTVSRLANQAIHERHGMHYLLFSFSMRY